jgi:type IV secretory pathway VirB6-like protein
VALTSADGGPTLPMSQFVGLLLTIALGFTMMTYYRAPIPGIGISFTQLLTDQPIFLARQLEVAQVQRLSERLNALYLSLEQPQLFNVSALVGYFLVALTVTAARVVLLAVIAFGLVATGVAVLVGPVFIPFFLVPHLDWLFWGWLKALLQYAFYQVIAQAFVFVFGSFLVNFLDAFPPPYTVDRLLVGGFHLIFLLCAFTYGLLKVPSLTSALFSGGAGETALPRFLER